MRGALGRRNNLWFLWESRFDPGLLQEEFLILELGHQGLKVHFFFLIEGSNNAIYCVSCIKDSVMLKIRIKSWECITLHNTMMVWFGFDTICISIVL